MNPLKRLGIALFKTLLDQGDLIVTQVLLPPIAGRAQARICKAVTGSPLPPQGRARLSSYRNLVTVTVDGAAVDGPVPGAWAKYAIPKGLPAVEGERPPFYLIVGLYAETRADLEAMLASPEGQAAVADVPRFATGGATFMFDAEEVLIPLKLE